MSEAFRPKCIGAVLLDGVIGLAICVHVSPSKEPSAMIRFVPLELTRM